MDANAELFQVIYVSTANAPFSQMDLCELLRVARQNNARLGLSGMLLYHDGNFIQALEGPRAAVLSVQERIARDPRHRGMLVLFQGPIAERSFAEWSMGFIDIAQAGASMPEGFSNFLVDGDLSKALVRDPKVARTLLQTFRSSVRR